MSTPHGGGTLPLGGPDVTPGPGDGKVEARVEIDVSVEHVWRALTDAEELTRWFPLHARVREGLGGNVWQSWSTTGGSVLDISVWEPLRHLRLTGREGEWAGLATDYHLEGKGGRTVLRVVSSGFGPDEDWEGLLGAFGLGWSFELEGLKHYLERHRGAPRVVARASRRYGCRPEEVWRAVVGPAGWLGGPAVEELTPGSAYSLTTSTGDRFSGVVRSVASPKQLVVTVREWNDALLRIAVHGAEHEHLLWVWVSCYGVPAPRVEALGDKWQASLDELEL